MPDTNYDRAIGRLESQIDGLSKQIDELKDIMRHNSVQVREDNERASESRKQLYERVGAIETDIKLSANIDVQVRERLDAFDTRLSGDVMPTINEVRRWKVAGVTAIAMIGMGSAAIGAFVMWAWETIVQRWQGGP